MTTKAGLATLIGGGYLLAFGLAGVNAASSAWTRWMFALVIVVGFLVTGWAVILPWDDARRPRPES
jgi:hypothetical protein